MSANGLERLKSSGVVVGVVLAILAGAGQATEILAGTELVPPAFQPWIYRVLLIGAFALILRALVFGPQARSRLIKPEALRLERRNQHHLVGRQYEIDRIIALATASPLLFVVGESGVGKSALLGAGVTPKLLAGGTMLPVYIESLAGPDWEDDAWRLLFLALGNALGREESAALNIQGLPPPARRKAILQSLRDRTARTPLIIIDQFDDYQARHWRRFHSQGSWTKSADLIRDNSFWRALADSARSRKLHLVIATRSDTALGLEAVRFLDPETFSVPRLEKTFIGELLDSIAPAAADGQAAIENPDAGWTKLRPRLTDDLGRGGAILPQQLKIALLGLATLPGQILSVAAYERAGSVAGLEAGWITARIKHATAGDGLSEDDILKLLLALVDPGDPRKTHDLSLETLAERCGFAPSQRAALDAALRQLEADEVVRSRREAGTEEERWRLDHDYLTGVVREAHRRANIWTTRLQQGQEALAAAGGHWRRWWKALLTPGVQWRFLGDRLRGRFRYGPYRGYALKSTARLAPALALIIGLPAALLYLDRQEERRAFAESMVSPFTDDGYLDDDETRALLEMATSDDRAASQILSKFLSSEIYISKLYMHSAQIGRALRWPSEPRRAARASRLLIDAMERNQGNGPVLFMLGSLLGNMAAPLSAEQAERVAAALTAAIGQGREPDTAAAQLWHAFVALADQLEPAQFEAGLARIVDVLRRSPERGGSNWAAFGDDAASLPPGLAASTLDRLLAVTEGEDELDADHIASALSALAGRLAPADRPRFADRMLILVRRNLRDSLRAVRFADALAAIEGPRPQAAEAARLIIGRMASRAGDELDYRWQSGLVALRDRVPARETDWLGASAIALAERPGTTAARRRAILGWFGDRLPRPRAESEAQIAMTALEALMASHPANNSVDMSAARMRRYEIGTLSAGLGRLAKRLSAESARSLATRLTNVMTDHPIAFADKTIFRPAFEGLAGHLAPAQRNEIAARLAAEMNDHASSDQSLCVLSTSLLALGQSVSLDAADRAAAVLMVVIQREGDDASADLLACLGDLAPQIRREAAERGRAMLASLETDEFPSDGHALIGAAIVRLGARLPEARQLTELFTFLADPFAADGVELVLRRLRALTGREFASERDAYRWLAAEQARGRHRSIDLTAIGRAMAEQAKTRRQALAVA